MAGRDAVRGATRRRIAALAAVLVTAFANPAPALAQDAAATVTIAAITPNSLVAPAPAATITLSGTVTNTSAAPIFHAQAVVWRAQDPIDSSAALAAAIGADPSSPAGTRLATAPGESVNLLPQGEPLAPGQTAAFTVSTTLARLGYTTLDAVYLVGVHVRGAATAAGIDSTLGRAKTFLPILSPGRGAAFCDVALLTSRPSLLPTGVFRDDHLAAELDGRLRGLLAAASRPGGTFLIDPALYREVRAMAKPYQVLSGKTVVPGTGTAAAAAWLADFQALLPRGGYRLPFGNPDLVAAATAPAADTVPRWQAALAATPELESLPLAVSLAAAPDPGLLAFLTGLGARVVLAPGLPEPPATFAAGVLVGVVPTSFTATPAPGTGGAQVQQLLLAQTLLAPAGSPPVRILATAAQAALDSTAQAAWTKPVPLQRLAAEATATWEPPADLAKPTPERGAEVLARLTSASTRLGVYEDLIGDKVTARLDAATTLSQALSRDWPSDSDAIDFLTAALPKGSGGEGVTLRASQRFVMSSASNPFPVTVVNSLGVTIQVRVAFTSEQPLRIKVPDSELVTVGPGEAVTVNVRPEALVNGLVNVTARLRTAGGAPLGRPVRIAVEATQFGLVGWIIVLSAGVVLIAATVLRIRQVQRERSGQETQ